MAFEIADNDFSEYKAAIEHYNQKNKRDYNVYLLRFEDDDLSDFLADFRAYDKIAKERIAQEKLERDSKKKLEQEKREANKALSAMKRLAKEMNLSLDEVRAKLGK